MRISSLALVLTVALLMSSCDTPAESTLKPQRDDWVANPITKPMGETFGLEVELGHRLVRTATIVDPIARVWTHNLVDVWLVWCSTVGESTLRITFEDGGAGDVRLICTEPDEIVGFINEWTPISFEGVVEGIGVAYVTGPLVEPRLDPLAVRCWDQGTLKYLMGYLEDIENPAYARIRCKWRPFPFEPRVGIPVNVAAHFREVDGREVQGLVVEPAELAEQVPIMLSLAAELNERTTSTIVASAGADVGLLCKETGQGMVRVIFRSTDVPDRAEFSVTCHAPHDQGGGG